MLSVEGTTCRRHCLFEQTPGTKGAGDASGTGLPIRRSGWSLCKYSQWTYSVSHGMVGGLRLLVKTTLGMSPSVSFDHIFLRFALAANPKHQLSGWTNICSQTSRTITYPSNWPLTDRRQAWVTSNREPETPATSLHNFQKFIWFSILKPTLALWKQQFEISQKHPKPMFFHQSKKIEHQISIINPSSSAENLWGHHHWHLWISSRS